ncbi:MAG: ATP-binding protein [bacterium]
MQVEDQKAKTGLCPFCDNSGWIIKEEKGIETVIRCDCFQAKRKKQLLASARIPYRYKHCTLENFEIMPRGKSPPQAHKTNQVSLGMIKEMADKFVREYPFIEGEGFLFMGQPGVGKTHLAVAIIVELITKKGIPCVFYDFRDLLAEIRSTYTTNSSLSESSVLRPVLEKEILVLDELGAQKVTEWMRDMLTYIINQRYSEKRTTIITSNWMDEADDEEDTLAGRIGYRLRSRLYEMCQVREIVGEDYRRKD